MHQNDYLRLRKKLQLQQVINASGRMTILGGSVLSPQVATLLYYGSQDYVEMKKLTTNAARYIATAFSVDGVHITSSGSNAIWQVISCLIHQGQKKYIFSPIKAVFNDKLANQIIIPKGHNINYGTRIETILELAGAKVVEAGSANMCSKSEVENSITPQTAGLMYVKSHHCVQKATLSYNEMIAIGKKHRLPVVVDASAEEDVVPLIKANPDAIIWSVSKALLGPAGGIIFGKQKIIEWLKEGKNGVERLAKVDKAIVFAIVQAVNDYFTKQKNDYAAILNYLTTNLKLISGLKIEQVRDHSRENIKRIRISLKANAPFSIDDLIKKLKEGQIAIYTRNYYQNLGFIDLDLRMFKANDEKLLIKKFQAIFNSK